MADRVITWSLATLYRSGAYRREGIDSTGEYVYESNLGRLDQRHDNLHLAYF